MKKSIFDRRIPTLFALILLVLGIGVTSFLTSRSIQITGFASPDERPQSVRISNVTDSSITISYTSAKAILGTINYGIGANALTETAADDRDKSGTPKQYQTHSITLHGLKPETSYYFSITSGGNVYIDGANPYSVKTGPVLTNGKPDKWNINGKILVSEDNANPAGLLVYITTKNGQSISTLTRDDGSFTLSTLNMRDEAFSKYLTLARDTKMEMIGLSATATTHALFTLENSNPLPDMTLSQNYDFSLTQPLLPENAASGSANTTFPFLTTQATEAPQVAIVSPKKDEHFTDQQPTFNGSSTPNQKVDILIESNTEIRANVTTNKQGIWSYRPEKPLDPGEHTITITTRDNNGLLRTLSRKFVVFAEGSQFTEPSISPVAPSVTTSNTPTPTPMPSPLAALTVTPELSPTTELSPTPALTISPTQMPSPVESQITPRPTIQPTGSSSLSSLTLLSIAMTLSGIILLILTRGGASL